MNSGRPVGLGRVSELPVRAGRVAISITGNYPLRGARTRAGVATKALKTSDFPHIVALGRVVAWGSESTQPRHVAGTEKYAIGRIKWGASVARCPPDRAYRLCSDGERLIIVGTCDMAR